MAYTTLYRWTLEPKRISQLKPIVYELFEKRVNFSYHNAEFSLLFDATYGIFHTEYITPFRGPFTFIDLMSLPIEGYTFCTKRKLNLDASCVEVKILDYSKTIDELENLKIVTTSPSLSQIASDPRYFTFDGKSYEVDYLGTILGKSITEKIVKAYTDRHKPAS